MEDIPESDMEEVGKAAHEVVQAAREAGVWIFGGGLRTQRANVVAANGAVSEGPDPETKVFLGGFSIVDVASHDEALAWAARFADACRCEQEVREIMYDPAV
jgi:hypothetical protein